jgi:hypothetical protein
MQLARSALSKEKKTGCPRMTGNGLSFFSAESTAAKWSRRNDGVVVDYGVISTSGYFLA